jgi:5'-nucleotidase
MSAAMEASLEGIDSIGFSLLDFSFDADFSEAKIYASTIIEKVLANGLNDCNLLNVNIPVPQDGVIRGVKVCKQAEGLWVEDFKEAKDPRGESYYWLTGKFEHTDKNELSDIFWLEQDYITVVPSHHDLTQYSAIPKINWLNQ